MLADRRGALGLPFRLLLAFTIATLAFPPLLQTYQGLQARLAREQLAGELARLEAAATAVFFGGPENVQQLRVDLNGGPHFAIREVIFGDPVGNRPAPLCTVRLSDGAELSYVFLDSQVPIGATGGGAATFPPQLWDLSLSYTSGPDGSFVAVEALP